MIFEDYYFWFLRPPLRLPFAIALILLPAMVAVVGLLMWMFSRNRRDD